jgi:hypothetical protein
MLAFEEHKSNLAVESNNKAETIMWLAYCFDMMLNKIDKYVALLD